MPTTRADVRSVPATAVTTGWIERRRACCAVPSLAREGRASEEDSHGPLPTDRRAWTDRGSPDGGAGHDRRQCGLVLLPAVRLAKCVRVTAARRRGWSVPDRRRRRRRRGPPAVLP